MRRCIDPTCANSRMAAASRADTIDLTEDDAPPMLHTTNSTAAAAATNTAAAAAATSNATAATSTSAQPALHSAAVLQQQQQALAFWQPSSTIAAAAESASQPTHSPTPLAPAPPLAQPVQLTDIALPLAAPLPPPLPPPLLMPPMQPAQPQLQPQLMQTQLQQQGTPQQLLQIPQLPPQPLQLPQIPPQPLHSQTLPSMSMQYGPYGPPISSYPLNYSFPAYGSIPQYSMQPDPNALLSQYAFAPPSYLPPLPVLQQPPMSYSAPQLSFAPLPMFPPNPMPQTPWITPMHTGFTDLPIALPLPTMAPTSLAAYQQTPVQDSGAATRKSSSYTLHHASLAPSEQANPPPRAYHASSYAVGHHPNQHSKREHLAAATQAARSALPRPPSPGTAEAAAAGIAAARSHPGFMGTHAMPTPSLAARPPYPGMPAKRKHIAHSNAMPAQANLSLSMRPAYFSPPAAVAPTLAWPVGQSPPVVVATKVGTATPVSLSTTVVQAFVAAPRRDHRGKHSKSAARRSHARAAAAAERDASPDLSLRRRDEHKRKQPPPRRSAPATDDEASYEDDEEDDEQEPAHVEEPRSFSLRDRPRRDSRAAAAAEAEEPREHSTRQRSARLLEAAAESRNTSHHLRTHRSTLHVEADDDELDRSIDDGDEDGQPPEDEDASMPSPRVDVGPGPIRTVAEWRSLQRRSNAPPHFQPYFPPVDQQVTVHPWMAGLRNPYYPSESATGMENSTKDALVQQRIDMTDVRRYLAIAPPADQAAATGDWTLPLPAASDPPLDLGLSQSALEVAIAADVQRLMEHSLSALRSRVPEQLAANRARIQRSVAHLSAPCAALAALPFSSITRSKLSDMPRAMRTPSNQLTSVYAAAAPVASSAALDAPADGDASMVPAGESHAATPLVSTDLDPDQVHAWRIDQSLYGAVRDSDKPTAADERKSRELLRSYVFPISLSVANNPTLLGGGGAYISDELSRDHTLPERTHYTTVRRNVAKEDDARLHFVPYFGDAEGVTVDVSLYRMGPHDEQSDNDEDVALEDEALQVHTDHVILAVLSKYSAGTAAQERVFEALAAALNNLLQGDGSPEPAPKHHAHGHASHAAQLAKRRIRDRATRLAKQRQAASEEEEDPNSSDERSADEAVEEDDDEADEEEEVVEEDLFTVTRLRKRWVQLSKQQAVQQARQQSLLERFGCDQLEQLELFEEFKRTRRLELQQQRADAPEQKEAAAPQHPTKKPRLSPAASSRASRSKGTAASAAVVTTPPSAAPSAAPALTIEQELEQLDVFRFKPSVAGSAAAAAASSSGALGSVPADFNLSRSYSKLFCRRCLVYGCRQHGPSQPRRKYLQLPTEPALNDVVGQMQLHGLSTAPLPEGQPGGTVEWPAPMASSVPRTNSSATARSAPVSESASPSPLPPHTPQWPGTLQGPCGPHCCKHVVAAEARGESKEDQRDHHQTTGEICREPACSMAMHLNAAGPGASSARCSEWMEVEKMVLRKLIFVFGTSAIPAPTLSGAGPQAPSVHSLNFCALANTLGSKTCAEVRAFVVSTASRGPAPFLTHDWMCAQEAQRAHQIDLENGGVVADAAAALQKKTKRKKKNQHTKAALQQRLRAAQRRSLNSLPHAFVPCDHPGIRCADAPSCPCARNMAFCEKYCACDSACSSATPGIPGLHAAHASPAGSSLCPNRFLGCARTCRGPNARCNTRTCPCFAANRECDPDLCDTCEPPSIHSNHAHPHAVSQLRAGDDDSISAGLRTPSPPVHSGAAASAAASTPPLTLGGRAACLNSSIQHRLHQPLLLGESIIHGWGCFLSATHGDVVAAAMATKTGQEINRKYREATGAAPAEPAEAGASSPVSPAATSAAAAASSSAAAAAPSGVVASSSPFLGVRKHDLITEYFGELISQGEADRRGKIYDRLNRSYLFNLNHEQVVDAARKGNKIKFANHSNQPNCYSKVMMIQGDHRIGIYAKRAIRPGEELLFDYQHQYSGPAPEWFLERRKAAAKGTHAHAARKSTPHNAAAAVAATTASSHAR